MASAERVLEVDMLGTDHVLNAFLDVVVDGTAAVCIASMAGYMANLTPAEEQALTAATTDGLMDALADVELGDFGSTYSVGKRVNQLRVEKAAVAWGARGGRVNSISPGIISTPMGRQELTEGAASRCRACSTSPRSRGSAPRRTSRPRCSGSRAGRRRSSAGATCASTAA